MGKVYRYVSVEERSGTDYLYIITYDPETGKRTRTFLKAISIWPAEIAEFFRFSKKERIEAVQTAKSKKIKTQTA